MTGLLGQGEPKICRGTTGPLHENDSTPSSALHHTASWQRANTGGTGRELLDVFKKDLMTGVKPAIAQLVEHLTVEFAEVRWSLVRFRVAGLAHCHGTHQNLADATGLEPAPAF